MEKTTRSNLLYSLFKKPLLVSILDIILTDNFIRKRSRKKWEKKWSDKNFNPGWLNRPISKEIVVAVDSGWFRPGGFALDVGCGQGDIAAWLAKKGFPVVAFDIAESVIRRACDRYTGMPNPPQFIQLDIGSEPPPNNQYSIIIDRGCFHQMPNRHIANYVKNITAVSSPNARMLLFIKAFRGRFKIGNPTEYKYHEENIKRTFSGKFCIDHTDITNLDKFEGQKPDLSLPGIVFWMRRIENNI